jgi:hypothetical protein
LECDSKTMRRMYVDVHGRLSTCCQLSEYGANESDVVVDLATTSFDDALELHKFRIDELKEISLPRANDDGLAAFPCLRCARATGKLAWLTNFPESPWHFATQQHMPADTPLVKVTYSRRARRSVSVAG